MLHTSICTSTYITHPSVHVQLFTHPYTCTHIPTHYTHLCTSTHISVHVYTSLYIYTHPYTCTHIPVHLHTSLYMYTHLCNSWWYLSLSFVTYMDMLLSIDNLCNYDPSLTTCICMYTCTCTCIFCLNYSIIA